MSNARYPVGVIGGGAWGTALATVMAQIHGEVVIWAREDEVVASINGVHENQAFLPGLSLSPNIHATGDLSKMVDCGALLIRQRLGAAIDGRQYDRPRNRNKGALQGIVLMFLFGAHRRC